MVQGERVKVGGVVRCGKETGQVGILAVILFSIGVSGLLRRERSRVDVELLATRKSVSSCCAASTAGGCH